MSSEIAIRVSGLGKCYQIYNKPSDRLMQSLWRGRRTFFREFWALRDVFLEVKKGEVVGIIGRNGSGKSTLLQLICGTLSATLGEVEVQGRVAALLELGAGFNPEFSGRENVYLNGAILGLGKAEIDARFDEIAAFADIGEFIDQPVKTYSSGMFVRLAFAVQACVEPDILIVDEALAVGDVFFRQKCYQRLERLRARGCSIILVTHAMTDVEQLCQRALVLQHGVPVFLGGASEAVKRYYLIEQQERALMESTPEASPALSAEALMHDHEVRWPSVDALLDIAAVPQISNGWARCTGVALCDAQGRPSCGFRQGETASFFYEFELLRDIESPIGGVVIQNDRGAIVHGKNTLQYGSPVPLAVRQGSRLRFRQDITLNIAAGEYTFEVGLAAVRGVDYQRRASFSNTEFNEKIIRLCHLPSAAPFVVNLGPRTDTGQLPFHGIADLPGACDMMVVPQLRQTD